VSLFENRYITKSGEVVRLSWHTRADDFTNFIYSTARNVTEERKKEEQLISSLSEKKLLLREIHHRVKNNLQVISSLLSLQSGMKNSDARLEQLYHDSQNRIKSMAAIHEMFYKSESLDRMDFPVYVRKLIIDLIYSLKGKESKIELDFHSEEVQFDLDTAIPLGLIINEIITNALKHAFNGRNSGVITVSFDTSDEDYVLLTIGDDGVGVPEEKDPLTLKNETLGMLLINSLIDQIGASIRFLKNKRGVNYEIQLPFN
jgi:two-component sensor histidine kinase